jgi:hypothetical protein
MFIPRTRREEFTEIRAMTRLADLPEIYNGLMFPTDAKDATQRAALGGTPWNFAVGEIDSNILL